MNNKEHNFTRVVIYICVLLITCTLILDRLIPEGLFLDGITYAAISRNLAIGKGTFWDLYYRGNWGFNEHPPLFFGLQAVFFKVLGDHYLTEKIYCFFIWIITVLLLQKLWKPGTTDTARYSFAMPLLMWCAIPTITWGYTNNILDCTMAMFDIAAVLAIYNGIASGKSRYGLITLGGLLIFAAMLTKGPVGTFPLVVPGIYWLVYQRNAAQFPRAFFQTIILAVVVAGCYALVYAFPESRANLERYLDAQVMAALSGDREITGGSLGRFALVADLLVQLIVPSALLLIVIILAKVARVKSLPNRAYNKQALFFLLIGLCASLPILLSVKQRTFYLVPSLPYFVMAVGMVAYPYYYSVTEKWPVGRSGYKYFRMVATVAVAALVVYLGSKVGQVGRDHYLIDNMKYIGSKFPKGKVVGICPEHDKDYMFLAYMQRYNRMEVSPVFYINSDILIDKNICNQDFIPVITDMGFVQQEFGLEQYAHYRRKFPIRFSFTQLNPVYRTRGK